MNGNIYLVKSYLSRSVVR